MEFIKRNKVFVFLVSVLVLSISLLMFNLLDRGNTSSTSVNSSTSNQNARVSNFQVRMNDNMQLVFDWNVQAGSNKIEKLEIYYEDQFLANVTDNASFTLDFLKSDVTTGNNAFTFKLYLSDKKVLEKTTYIYIDEVFGFSMLDSKQQDVVMVVLNYTYDKTKQIGDSKVRFDVSQKVNTSINYVESSILSEDTRFIKKRDVYEIDISQLDVGQYQYDLIWYFDSSDITYRNTVNVEVLPK